MYILRKNINLPWIYAVYKNLHSTRKYPDISDKASTHMFV